MTRIIKLQVGYERESIAFRKMFKLRKWEVIQIQRSNTIFYFFCTFEGGLCDRKSITVKNQSIKMVKISTLLSSILIRSNKFIRDLLILTLKRIFTLSTHPSQLLNLRKQN